MTVQRGSITYVPSLHLDTKTLLDAREELTTKSILKQCGLHSASACDKVTAEVVLACIDWLLDNERELMENTNDSSSQ